MYIMASEMSLARKAEAVRGVMTLHQTEQWFFVTSQTMQANRKALVNFPNCTTASQCIGPIDVPDPTKGWHLTVRAKRKIYGEAMIRPCGKADIGEPKEVNTAGSAVSQTKRIADTVEPITFQGTGDDTWVELLNIAGANSSAPKMVCELVATDDTLSFLCLRKKIPYLGITFNEYHRDLLRQRLAQRVFESMRADEESPFGTRSSCLELKKVLDGRGADDDDEEEEDETAQEAAKPKAASKAKGKAKGKGKAKSKVTPNAQNKRKCKAKQGNDDDLEDSADAAGPAAKRAALLAKLNSQMESDGDEEMDDQDGGDDVDEEEDEEHVE